MARFYLYDLSRYCGFISPEWACPPDGLYECMDFKDYFEDPHKKAYLVKVDEELGGFVLLNRKGTITKTDWNMGQFFIVAKFQGRGIAKQAAHKVWRQYKGAWEVAVIPENLRALSFWRKAISNFTHGTYKEEMKTITYDKDQPLRHIFFFTST